MFLPGRGLDFISLSEWSYVHVRFSNKRCDFFFFSLNFSPLEFIFSLASIVRQCVGGYGVVLHCAKAASGFCVIVLRCPTKEHCVDEKLLYSSKLRT